MLEITFQVEIDADDGGYVASWDDPEGGGITTQGDTLAELQTMIVDVMGGYFGERQNEPPKRFRLHFLQDPVIPVAQSARK